MLKGEYLHGLTFSLFLMPILLLLIASLSLGGCSASFKMGKNFYPANLESSLVSGESDSMEVFKVLGEPFGRGRAMMPYHKEPRTVWTYYFEHGIVDLAGGDNYDRRKYLFVFLDANIYEGYLWFESTLKEE